RWRHAASSLRRTCRRRDDDDERPFYREGLGRGRSAPPSHRQPWRSQRGRDDDSPDRGERVKANVNGIETYYEVHGKEGAPWLVFSHSLACSVRMWDGETAKHKERFRVLAYDTRGHGQSAAPKGPYTLEQ